MASGCFVVVAVVVAVPVVVVGRGSGTGHRRMLWNVTVSRLTSQRHGEICIGTGIGLRGAQSLARSVVRHVMEPVARQGHLSQLIAPHAVHSTAWKDAGLRKVLGSETGAYETSRAVGRGGGKGWKEGEIDARICQGGKVTGELSAWDAYGNAYYNCSCIVFILIVWR